MSVMNQGLGSRAVNNLSISADGLHLYAGTEGSGVYRLDLNGQVPESLTTQVPAVTASPYEYRGASTATNLRVPVTLQYPPSRAAQKVPRARVPSSPLALSSSPCAGSKTDLPPAER